MATEITSGWRGVSKRKLALVDWLGGVLVAIGVASSLLGALGRPGLSQHQVVLYWTTTFDVLNNFIPFWTVMITIGLLILVVRRTASRMMLLFGTLGLVAALVPIALEARRAPAEVEPGSAQVFRVLQFNALNPNRNLDDALALVLQSNADVVMVQEPLRFRQLEPQLRKAYPYRTPCPRRSCQALIYARHPPIAQDYQTFRGNWYPKKGTPGNGPLSVARMRLLAPDGAPFTVVTTHFRWPFPPMPVLHQRDVFLEIIADVDRTRAIVGGDFNLTPWTFEMRGFDQDIRPMRRITNALFSFPTNLTKGAISAPFPFLPIDHVYAGPDWRLVQARRGEVAGSDHYPIIVDLVMTPGASRR